MEIYIKDEVTHKLNWFSSLPDKYRNEIVKRVKLSTQERTLHETLTSDAPDKVDNNLYKVVLNIASKDKPEPPPRPGTSSSTSGPFVSSAETKTRTTNQERGIQHVEVEMPLAGPPRAKRSMQKSSSELSLHPSVQS